MAITDPDSKAPARYSKLVSILKVVLPLAALILLSLVFMLARTVDPSEAISNAEIDVEERARDPRLSGAHFAGVTDDGAALTIRAETARTDQDATVRFEVTGLSLLIEGADGERMEAQAEAGVIDRGNGTFVMRGGLELSVTPGYSLQTQRLSGLLDTTLIRAPSEVSGTAPAGTITAGRMELHGDSGDGTGYVLVFGGGVRLNYQPEN